MRIMVSVTRSAIGERSTLGSFRHPQDEENEDGHPEGIRGDRGGSGTVALIQYGMRGFESSARCLYGDQMIPRRAFEGSPRFASSDSRGGCRQ